ncbi:MAG: NAD(P)/FAD-dependent oxidoreductase [Pyrinomonadaceae bacterium]
MRRYDAVIIGAGLAGLWLARKLGRAGLKVLLADRKNDLSQSIHTTGIFVRKTFEDFEFPEHALGRPISSVTLYSPGLRAFAMNSNTPEYRVGNMALIYSRLLEECIQSGVEFLAGTSFKGSTAVEEHGESIVFLESAGAETRVFAKVLVGADGAASRVAIDLGLERNREMIVGFEGVYEASDAVGKGLHCFLSEKFAPGYLAWVSNDGTEMHVGVAGYADRFSPRAAFKGFCESIRETQFDGEFPKLKETRGGRIPVGGILRRIACERGILIGDAAGAVSPLTAGGLDPAIRLSEHAADVILKRVEAADPSVLFEYSGSRFRSKFALRLAMRTFLKYLRSEFLLESVFVFLNSAVGRWIARGIFYRRASFPDVAPRGIGAFKTADTNQVKL